MCAAWSEYVRSLIRAAAVAAAHALDDHYHLICLPTSFPPQPRSHSLCISSFIVLDCKVRASAAYIEYHSLARTTALSVWLALFVVHFVVCRAVAAAASAAAGGLGGHCARFEALRYLFD